MNKAILFDIQRNSFVDGPGIRTTVFFKGCTYNQPTFEGMRCYILFPEGEGVYGKYVDLSPLVICLLSPTGVCGNGEL